MVHSGAGPTSAFVERGDRATMLAAHRGNLREIADGRPLWVPVFNYGFCRGEQLDVASTPSELGPIGEAYRTSEATWRTPVPVFSFAGVDGAPAALEAREPVVDPFDGRSAFGELHDRDGVVVWYGAAFSTTTFVHYVERLAGGPLYRYDKRFPGTVRDASGSREVELVYHVRPAGTALDYAWDDLLVRARADGVVRDLDGDGRVRWASASALARTWLEQMEADPLALLDDPSRTGVGAEVERLGRRLEIGDFE
jgi:aminoglycoside 3-N-acetyltransferase